MSRPIYDELFESVPGAQRQTLERFWLDHTATVRTLGETPWRYTVMGTGRRMVVLLPHALLPADSWLNLALALQNDYRLLIPDGYALQSVFEPPRLCETIIQMIEAEGGFSAAVVAHSCGGSLAQLLLERWPHRVQHLILCHSPALSPDTPVPYAGREGWLRVAPTWPVGERAVRGLAPGLPAEGEWLAYVQAYLRLYLLEVQRRTLSRVLSAERLMRLLADSQPSAATNWPGSLLMITARDDPFTAGSLAIFRERYPRVLASSFEQGGHWAHMLYPETLGGRIIRHLEERTP